MTNPQPHFMTVGTVASELRRSSGDCALVDQHNLPNWVSQLPLRDGWQLAQFTAGTAQPARLAVHGAHHKNGWDGCEIVAIFRCTATPQDGFISRASNQMLHDLGAEEITTTPVVLGSTRSVIGVRSTGHFTVAGRTLWLQYSTYLVKSEPTGSGQLIEHGIYVESASRAGLNHDVTELSDAVIVGITANIAPGPNHITGTTRDLRSTPAATAKSKGGDMAIFRVGFFPDFDLGNDVVLVGADRDGMSEFRSALRSAHDYGDATFELHGVQHRVTRETGAADVEFGWQTVHWRFDETRLTETLGLIEPLIDSQTPGHNYLDELNSPAGTLVLSVDEYVTGGPFAQYPQGLPIPTRP